VSQLSLAACQKSGPTIFFYQLLNSEILMRLSNWYYVSEGYFPILSFIPTAWVGLVFQFNADFHVLPKFSHSLPIILVFYWTVMASSFPQPIQYSIRRIVRHAQPTEEDTENKSRCENHFQIQLQQSQYNNSYWHSNCILVTWVDNSALDHAF
jgi:hypothetical protein